VFRRRSLRRLGDGKQPEEKVGQEEQKERVGFREIGGEKKARVIINISTREGVRYCRNEGKREKPRSGEK